MKVKHNSGKTTHDWVLITQAPTNRRSVVLVWPNEAVNGPYGYGSTNTKRTLSPKLEYFLER